MLHFIHTCCIHVKQTGGPRKAASPGQAGVDRREHYQVDQRVVGQLVAKGGIRGQAFRHGTSRTRNCSKNYCLVDTTVCSLCPIRNISFSLFLPLFPPQLNHTRFLPHKNTKTIHQSSIWDTGKRELRKCHLLFTKTIIREVSKIKPDCLIYTKHY